MIKTRNGNLLRFVCGLIGHRWHDHNRTRTCLRCKMTFQDDLIRQHRR